MGSLTPREIAESIVNARAERRDPEQILDWAVGALYLYCDEEARQKASLKAAIFPGMALVSHQELPIGYAKWPRKWREEWRISRCTDR